MLSSGKVANPCVSRILKWCHRGVLVWRVVLSLQSSWRHMQCEHLWDEQFGCQAQPQQAVHTQDMCVFQGMSACAQVSLCSSAACAFLGKGSWKGIQIRSQLHYGGNLVK